MSTEIDKWADIIAVAIKQAEANGMTVCIDETNDRGKYGDDLRLIVYPNDHSWHQKVVEW